MTSRKSSCNSGNISSHRSVLLQVRPRPPVHFCVSHRLFELGVFALCRAKQVDHAYPVAAVGREKGRVERDVANVAASNAQPAQNLEVQIVEWRVRGKYTPPDLAPLTCVRKGKLQHETNAPKESRVERATQIRRKNSQTSVRFHALQQIADLDIGVAVVTIFDFAALTKQRVGFVEKEDGATIFSGVKDTAQVLLSLANVFAHNRRQIDAIQIQTQL